MGGGDGVTDSLESLRPGCAALQQGVKIVNVIKGLKKELRFKLRLKRQPRPLPVMATSEPCLAKATLQGHLLPPLTCLVPNELLRLPGAPCYPGNVVNGHLFGQVQTLKPSAMTMLVCVKKGSCPQHGSSLPCPGDAPANPPSSLSSAHWSEVTSDKVPWLLKSPWACRSSSLSLSRVN